MTGANYEIVVQGRLGCELTRWPDDVEVRAAGPDATQLVGWFADQAALQGLLRRLGERGLELSLLRRLPESSGADR